MTVNLVYPDFHREKEYDIIRCSTKCLQYTKKLTQIVSLIYRTEPKQKKTRMWANAQPDGRPAEHRWRPLFNAAKFG